MTRKEGSRTLRQRWVLLPLLLYLCTPIFLAVEALSNTPIITCASSSELERAVSFFCKPEDNCLDLGAQCSDVSLKLCQTVNTAVLVDVERSETKSGRCTHRDVTKFQSLSGVRLVDLASLDDWKERIFGIGNNNNPPRFDIVLVDLSHMIGNDLYLSTLALTNEVLETCNPRVILVKSKSLASLSRRFLPAQHLLQGHRSMEPRVERSSEPYVLCAVGVEEYRRLIPFTVKPGDAVIEVGCHFGRSTTLLHEAAAAKDDGFCIGVDIGPKIIENAKSQYPSVQFEVGDARKTLDLLRLRKDDSHLLGYDVVFADIGGLSGAHGTLEALTLLDSLANALQPRSIVIKSLCMKRLASQLRSFTLIWAKNRDGATVESGQTK